ncbi:calcium-binding protein, partial [Microvirga sp. 0TCS3.31]
TIRNIENVRGGTAGDQLTGDGSANVLQGLGGVDILNGAGGIDTADYSEKAAAVVVTLAGDAVVRVFIGGPPGSVGGGVAEDFILNIENVRGGAAGDQLTGDGSANVLEGNDGNDLLNGGAGNDTLDGGAGDDELTGGGGADNYDYNFVFDSSSSSGIDLITQFVSTEGDKINLLDIDANSSVAGDQAFTFIGQAAFSAVPGQLRLDTVTAGQTRVLGDNNGDGLADLEIEIQLTSTLLSSNDFVL